MWSQLLGELRLGDSLSLGGRDCSEITPLCSSLGDKVRACLKKERKKRRRKGGREGGRKGGKNKKKEERMQE